jgi:NitT/TauT family transport system substrate-binding protein
VNTLNSIDHVAMQQWLQKRGVDPAKVHFTEVDFPQMVTPLMHGQVDAALASEPFVTVAKSLGAEVIGYDFADLSQRTLLASFVAQRSWVKAHQSLVKRFALAFEQGQKYANKHSATARSYITKFTPIPAAVVNTINLTSWRKLKASDLSYWVKLGVRWHALDKSIKVNGLMWPTAR